MISSLGRASQKNAGKRVFLSKKTGQALVFCDNMKKLAGIPAICGGKMRNITIAGIDFLMSVRAMRRM
jgi:hypothetical protein